MTERLQKILSARGISSRREAEKLIISGRVAVNGVTARLGQSADPERDVITVDGRALPARPDPVYIMLNKPRGVVTTMRDERGRRTVADLVKGCKARVYPVGRLDMDSEGLLILTNDGELAQRLAHPSGGKEKTYRVEVRGEVEAAITALSRPMLIDGYRVRPAVVELIGKTPGGGVISVKIREGRNRQVRKMCQAVGLVVVSLRRVEEGGVVLGDLEPGKWRHLTEEEVRLLKNAGSGG